MKYTDEDDGTEKGLEIYIDINTGDLYIKTIDHNGIDEWSQFKLEKKFDTIGKVTKLTNHNRPKVLIFDNSSYDRVVNQ